MKISYCRGLRHGNLSAIRHATQRGLHQLQQLNAHTEAGDPHARRVHGQTPLGIQGFRTNPKGRWSIAYSCKYLMFDIMCSNMEQKIVLLNQMSKLSIKIRNKGLQYWKGWFIWNNIQLFWTKCSKIQNNCDIFTGMFHRLFSSFSSLTIICPLGLFESLSNISILRSFHWPTQLYFFTESPFQYSRYPTIAVHTV